MKPLLIPSIVVLLTGALPAAAEPTAVSPAQFAALFCSARVSQQMDRIEPLLSPDFAATLAQAKADKLYRDTHGTVIYPMDPTDTRVVWPTMLKTVMECAVTTLSESGNEAQVGIGVTFDDHEVEQQTLILAKTQPGDQSEPVWQLDDILINGTNFRQRADPRTPA